MERWISQAVLWDLFAPFSALCGEIALTIFIVLRVQEEVKALRIISTGFLYLFGIFIFLFAFKFIAFGKSNRIKSFFRAIGYWGILTAIGFCLSYFPFGVRSCIAAIFLGIVIYCALSALEYHIQRGQPSRKYGKPGNVSNED